MSTIQERLLNILETRKMRLIELEDYIVQWSSLTQSIESLGVALTELSTHPSAPEGASELGARIKRLPSLIESDVRQRLARVARRFQRDTINIGVGGRARVGKSTMLQNLSGLDEDQIPTGEAGAVTAARSRIFHSETLEHADISFHTWESFKQDSLAPYFAALGLGSPPLGPEEFQRFKMPPRPGSTTHHNSETLAAYWDRLSEMHKSFATYRTYLTGGMKRYSLEEIRRFVAYPNEEQKRAELNGIPAPRCYLAVRDAQIYCAFEQTNVSKIGIIDLPGTGEIVAGGENRHVAELEDEVDFVFQVCRPSRYSMWEMQDSKTLELIKQSRCGAEPSDFCWILLNQGGATELQLNSFEMELDKKTTGFTHRRMDAANPNSVHNDALAPALEHLTQRLPDMDRAAMKFATEGVGVILEQLSLILSEVQSMLNGMPPTASSEGRRRELAMQLKKILGANFFDLLVSLRERIEDGDTTEFEMAVQQCEDECQNFLDNGLGHDESAWLANAVMELKTSKQTHKFANEELDRVRVTFSRKFNLLDVLLQLRIQELHGQIAALLNERIPLCGSTSKEQLEDFLSLVAETGSDDIQAAIQELLDLQISYRSHFHPQIRRAMVFLEPEFHHHNQVSGRIGRIEHVTFDENGARDLLIQLQNLGGKVIGKCSRELYGRANLPDLVIYAAGEQFSDALFRSGGYSDEFFHRMADLHRDRIWPEEFRALDSQHRLHKNCRTMLTHCQKALNILKRGQNV